MSYVDGFVLVVHKDKVDEYRKMAELGGRLWIEHGALDFKECMADDVQTSGLKTTFPGLMAAGPDETVFFSFITHESRAARDATNAKVMADPRLCMPEGGMPFDIERMAWGGFTPLVDMQQGDKT